MPVILWLALVVADFQATLAQFKASEQGRIGVFSF
jgi:hypothetical protein